ncbi:MULTISPECIES: haloacid dehalogenase type II [Gammaproteobacteria]|uniref:(S)-2-haloacid dehalogenase n=2 Tax=Gammaproteobacteria TaxID=1236 RepID=A0A3E0DR27_9GAMM|nr:MULTISPECIES: haloacid dehalogenase type II [Gammaproteobacteria]MCK8073478.1 haloacid dehalogenase type II [Vibrio sp. 1CM23M]MCK8103113.1 haloacid dehalogenase type II [Pseudoalteromonas sp. 2CM36K]MCY9863335.1 haloacid dehalogenase type II [Vibrio coralliirubri]MEE1673601.1 haloacid dehalogenase type II [Agarivorans aestuarii]PMJ63841.1 haloacid dehalogenase, type II [Vibrio lentus]
MPVQTILFDINETVLDLNRLKPKFNHYFGSEDYMTTWFSMLLHSSTVCLVTTVHSDFKSLALTALKALAGRLDKSISDEGYQDILSTLAALPAHEDVKPAMDMLKLSGFRLVALSNSSTKLLNSQLSFAGLKDYFDDTISVEQANTFKPSKSAYLFALQQLQIAPSQARLVATHDWDTHGALSAGLKAAYINRSGAPYNSYYLMPDIVSNSMIEIAQQIMEKENRQP